jgi:hypothetical protein
LPKTPFVEKVRCRKSGEHPLEYLAKFSSKPDIEHKFFILFQSKWYTNLVILSFLGGGGGGPFGIAKPQLAIKKNLNFEFSLLIFPFGEQKTHNASLRSTQLSTDPWAFYQFCLLLGCFPIAYQPVFSFKFVM